VRARNDHLRQHFAKAIGFSGLADDLERRDHRRQRLLAADLRHDPAHEENVSDRKNQPHDEV